MIISHLLCGLTVWMVMSVIFQLHEVATTGWSIDLFENIINLPWNIVGYIVRYTILYPFFCVWRFFYKAIRGVPKQAWEDAKPKLRREWKFGCFRLCYRHNACRLYDKFFLVRLVEPAEKINHTLQE